MRYRLDVKPSAAKEMRNLPNSVLSRINARNKSLAENPYERSAKKLVGSSRVAVGAYRIIYRIDDTSKVVSILSVRHRREAYR